MQKIIVELEDKQILGTINDTLAGKQFIKRLPFTCLCKNDQEVIWGRTANDVFEPYDLQLGCKNGDIVLWGNCFMVAYAVENSFKEDELMMVIGHIDDYQQLIDVPKSIKLKVILAS